MQQKRKKSKSSIILIILIVLFITAGVALIAYPVLTDMPSIFKKESSIKSWQLMKDKFIGKSGENQNSKTTISSNSEITNQAENAEIASRTIKTGISEQNNQTQSTTSTTTTKSTTKVKSNEIIQYMVADIFPAKITIPEINVEWIVNEGADIPILKKGPGHIPETPLPGEEGRFTISGHRTTYGAPFNRIDELKNGDLIYLEALNGNQYVYKVTSFQIVKPTYVEILNGTDKKELLLTTCYPEYSAKERLVVISELVNIFLIDMDLN